MNEPAEARDGGLGSAIRELRALLPRVDVVVGIAEVLLEDIKEGRKGLAVEGSVFNIPFNFVVRLK